MMWREIRIPNSNIYPQGSPNEMHIGIHRQISVVYLNLEKEIWMEIFHVTECLVDFNLNLKRILDSPKAILVQYFEPI